MIDKSNPSGLHPTPGYHHVNVSAASRMAFLAGQCPLDEHGALVGAHDLAAQVDQVARNIATAVASLNATAADVVRTVIYVASADRDDLARVWSRFRASEVSEAFESASTLLGVTQLGHADQLVEVDVTLALEA